MSRRQKMLSFDIKTKNRNTELVEGSFQVGATGAVGKRTPADGGWTATRVNTGCYTIALERCYKSVRGRADIMYAANTAVDALRGVIASPSVNDSTPTFQIMMLNGATPTDPASGDHVVFSAILSMGRSA